MSAPVERCLKSARDDVAAANADRLHTRHGGRTEPSCRDADAADEHRPYLHFFGIGHFGNSAPPKPNRLLRTEDVRKTP